MTRYRVIGLTFCLGLAVGLFFVLGPFGEPSYQGRTLTEWLDGVASPVALSRPMATQQALDDAIKHMGPRGVVALAKCIDGEPVLGFRRIARIRSALPLSLRSSRLMFWLERRAAGSETASQVRASVAAMALISLREDARPALPWLVRGFRRPGSAFDNYRAAEVLAGLGRVALPEVLECLADPRFSNRQALALVIGRMHGLGEAGVPAVPLLCKGLRQGGPGLSQACAGALGNLAVTPELAVPALGGALSNALRTTDVTGYGVAASNAIPLVRDALKDDDHDTRAAAQAALQAISPE